jgi:hypothetical protein
MYDEPLLRRTDVRFEFYVDYKLCSEPIRTHTKMKLIYKPLDGWACSTNRGEVECI